MSRRRRRILYQDTSVAVFSMQVGGYVVVLFDSNDHPLFKLTGEEAGQMLHSVGQLDLDALGTTRRLQRLIYERAVADGVIVNPERSTHVADA